MTQYKFLSWADVHWDKFAAKCVTLADTDEVERAIFQRAIDGQFDFTLFAGAMNDVADLLFVQPGFFAQLLDGDAFFVSLHDGEHLIGGGVGPGLWGELLFGNRRFWGR